MNVVEEEVQEDMDFISIIPLEVLEEIFQYLSSKDLASCAAVSLRWREATNNNKLWNNLCTDLIGTGSPCLSDTESNFLNLKYQFGIPGNEPRLIPICESKLHYCQQKFLSYNWRRGRYVTHWFGKNIKVPESLTFASTDSNERLFYPITEVKNHGSAFCVMRVDGKPTKVCELEHSLNQFINVVCVDEFAIAYVYDNKVKLATCIDGFRFRVTQELDIIPVEYELIKRNTRVVVQSCIKDHYFIKMNSDFIIAGESFYINIWCRKTGEKKGFVTSPIVNASFSSILLYKGFIYIATANNENKTYAIFEYDILDNKLNQIDNVQNFVKKFIVNDGYLLVIMNLDVNRNDIVVYDRKNIKRLWSISQDTSENWAVVEPQVLLLKNLIFYLEGYSIKIIGINDPNVKSEFQVTSTVFSMSNVRQNLLIIKTRSEVEIWDWEKGIKLYTPCVECDDASKVFHDSVRLTLFYEGLGEVRIVGFW
ncbi:uncharacterized protein LOC142333211 isoform X2 [Lycorma delicatula]|uniref:uncharacterized protein LOC142333211 isoform X2 n=1 Tax=Lycorma delicatula TaxID=130591 RepID=UPI003F514F75